MIGRLLAGWLIALPAFACAAESGAGQRPRDAAEAVQEGDVSQWLKYYQRERGMQAPEPAPRKPACGDGAAPAEANPAQARPEPGRD